ncbi:DUF1559 family PulG-like putative transporter [Lacipirellula limnantheis]|uniref:DUF1559 domain-containing protein n=1 Tax=Lacipirellula limnantheis TaxID=2528024 RepID=A0A517TS59_9BACT|nr:DUF1559 domain-containing protein [Lacipirellula limnantheis]QDT71207.1 hypothetical protein I41_03620 [Lacipirellula limnantheis]
MASGSAGRVKFRLGTIAYVFALLAAAMATFGPVAGIILGGLILAGWYDVVSGRRGVGPLALVGTLGFTALVLLPPFIANASNAARRNDCLSNLKQILLGLSNYESANGAFPPAYVADAEGKPMHSWRVLILPYMEQKQLYDQYDFDEPWDGPNNRKLWDQIPYFYSCKGCERCRDLGGEPFGKMPGNASNYVAVVGDATAWPEGKQVKWSDLADGSSQTLLILEHSGITKPWTAPVDLTMDEAIEQLTHNDAHGHVSVDESLIAATFDGSWRMVGFCDAHVMDLPAGLSEEAARALLTIAGGESLDNDPESWLGERAAPRLVKVIRYERVYGLLAFVGLAIWPGVRRWRRA